MKRLVYIFALLTLSIGLANCGKKDKSESIRSGRCGRGACNNGATGPQPNGSTGSGGPLQPVNGKVWGEITRDLYPQSNFDIWIKGFASATLNTWDNPSELGFVSGDSGQDTGVRFYGNVELINGAFNPNGSANSNIRNESAELRIVIWDSYAGQTDSEGNVIPEYPVHIIGATGGSVNGNQAQITFKDGYGQVVMKGTFDQDWFWGEAWYDNSQYADGERPGAANRLGFFSVRTWGFFRCN